MLSSACLREEGIEGVIGLPNAVIIRHLSVRLDPVLETVELPAGIAHLDTGLADVKGNDFAHLHLAADIKLADISPANINTNTLPQGRHVLGLIIQIRGGLCAF